MSVKLLGLCSPRDGAILEGMANNHRRGIYAPDWTTLVLFRALSL